MALGKMDVDHCLAQVGMAQQQLDGAQVSPGLKQMSREAMAEGLLILLMIRSQPRSAIAFIRSMAQKLK